MRRVALADAAALVELARDVPGPHPAGPPLLCAGMRLDPAVIARAAASGVTTVWVNDELGEGIEPPPALDAGVSATVLRAVDRIFAAARHASQAGRQLEMGVLRDAQHAAGELVAPVRDGVHDGGEPPLDPHGHHHALRVALLGMSLGLGALAEPEHERSGGHDRLIERLTLLGAGLLMHDLGKGLAAGRGGHDTESAADDDARHAIAGEALMPSSLFPLQVRSVVRSHHEHWDGSGRPDRKAGTAIHLFARIAAVADAYDGRIVARGGGVALPRHLAVAQIEAAAGTRFDPAVVAAFSELVPPFPAGSAVTLADGREGVVVRAAADDRLRPLVRVAASGGLEEVIVDLSERASPALLHDGPVA